MTFAATLINSRRLAIVCALMLAFLIVAMMLSVDPAAAARPFR
jgi:hypothetical protein